jgi:hypothetical protein
MCQVPPAWLCLDELLPALLMAVHPVRWGRLAPVPLAQHPVARFSDDLILEAFDLDPAALQLGEEWLARHH